MTHQYRRAVDCLFRIHRETLIRWLQRRFHAAPLALVQDAVADAFADALDHPGPFVDRWRAGAADALLAALRQAAWRRLRGYLRKRATRCEVPATGRLDSADQPNGPSTPYAIVAGQQTLSRVIALVDEAASRFGRRRKRALCDALHARLAGATDAEVARRFAVPREYVNRARRWIGGQLRTDRVL